MIELYNEDCLAFMRRQRARTFRAACFSPPYDTGGDERVFNVRFDFRQGGRFIPYALELSRVCDVWAINLTQRVFEGRNLPFIEELVMALGREGVELFDRWVLGKSAGRPARGERALARHEYVLLFSACRPELRKAVDGKTLLNAVAHNRAVSTGLGFTPYAPEIPRQVFSMYGRPGPVLDPFCGTGTSLLEARALGLRSVGVELDKATFERGREEFGIL